MKQTFSFFLSKEQKEKKEKKCFSLLNTKTDGPENGE